METLETLEAQALRERKPIDAAASTPFFSSLRTLLSSVAISAVSVNIWWSLATWLWPTLTNFDQLWPKAAQGTQAAVISSSNFRQLTSCSRASFLSWANSLASITPKKHPCMAPQINYQLWLIWEETWGHRHGLMIECWILHIFLQQPSQELVRYKQHTLLWNAGHVLLQTCSSRNNTWTVKNYSFTCQSEDPNNDCKLFKDFLGT